MLLFTVFKILHTSIQITKPYYIQVHTKRIGYIWPAGMHGKLWINMVLILAKTTKQLKFL